MQPLSNFYHLMIKTNTKMTIFKNVILVLPLSILSLNGFSQNFEPVYFGKEYLFSVPKESNLNKPFNNSNENNPIGIRVKKDTTINKNTVYFFNSQIRNRCDSLSAFGKKVLVEKDKSVFFNAAGDSIIIKKNEVIGSEWRMFTYADSSYLLAKIEALSPMVALNYKDTAKVITLSYKDKKGNNLYHIFNKKSFVLGKNLGFIKTYDFASFPADTMALQLAGLSSPAIGIQNIKEKDIYNFEVGDEFHYKGNIRYVLWAGTSYAYSELILSKTLSANGDTTTYKIAKKYCSRSWEYSMEKSKYFKHDTILLKLVSEHLKGVFFNSKHNLNNVPFEGVLNSNYSHSEIYAANDTTYKFTKSGYNRNNNGCYSEMIGRGIFNKYTYTSGFGIIKMEGDAEVCNQVYYKKKNKVWGTSIDFQSLLSNEVETEFKNSIEVMPNPASDFLIVKSKEQSSLNFVSITNVCGKIILNQEFAPSAEARIDISSLQNGIYLVKIKDGKREFNTKIVVAK